MAVQIQIRRDTAANFTAADPLLAQGEWALETDTGLVKIGDGSTAYNSLTYFPGASYGYLDSSTTFAGDISGLYNAIVVDKASQDFALTGDATSTDTGTVNDYALGAAISVLRWNGASAATLNGITGGGDGRLLFIFNVTAAETLTLAHEAGASTAANRLYAPGSADMPVPKNSGVVLMYDSTSSRWRIVGGGALSGATPGAVGTAGSAGTGTLASRDDHVHAHEAAHINHDTTWAAKGDLIVGTANDTAAILSKGTDGYILEAASGEATGLRWAAAAGAIKQHDYGSGVDGDATLDGSTTIKTMVPSSSTYTMDRDYYWNDLTVNSGVTLKTAGYRLFCNGTLTVNGHINDDGNDASGSTGGAARAAGWFPVTEGGPAGVLSGAGGNVGAWPTSARTNSSYAGQLYALGGRGACAWASALTYSPGGCTTVSPGTYPQTAGYANMSYGGARQFAEFETYRAKGNLWAVTGSTTSAYQAILTGGGGGSGAKSTTGTSCYSGGGGAGGGVCFVMARTLVIGAAGILSADGGDGGNAGGTGANAGGGGGGGGGYVVYGYDSLSNSGTIRANGGAGGTSVQLGSTPTRAVITNFSSGLVASVLPGTDAYVTFYGNTVSMPQSPRHTLLACVSSYSGASSPTLTVTGGGLTWTSITSVSSGNNKMQLFYATGHASQVYTEDPTTWYIRANSTVSSNLSIFLFPIENLDLGAVPVQSATNTTAGATSLTVTLPGACAGSNSQVMGFFTTFGASVSGISAGSGLSLCTNNGSRYLWAETGYNDTTVDTSWTTSRAAVGIAVEMPTITGGNAESGFAGQDGFILDFSSNTPATTPTW